MSEILHWSNLEKNRFSFFHSGFLHILVESDVYLLRFPFTSTVVGRRGMLFIRMAGIVQWVSRRCACINNYNVFVLNVNHGCSKMHEYDKVLFP